MPEILSSEKILNIVLIGAPNSGKTTLYNWLTGSKHKTVNYPGATIEFSKGELKPELIGKFNTQNFDQYVIYDTPGIYSLSPKSADEEVTYRILTEQKLFQIDLAFIVMDTTQLNRQFIICAQLKEMNIPYQIIFTMNDVSKLEGLNIVDSEILKEFDQKQILRFDGILGQGLMEITNYINQFKPMCYKALKPRWDLKSIQNLTEKLKLSRNPHFSQIACPSFPVKNHLKL